MCGPLTGMMSSIGTIVTLSENVLLLVLRYASSYDPVRTFFIKMWVIPKVMPHILEELLPLLKCQTWRQKLCNDKISSRDPGFAYVIPFTTHSHGEPRAVSTFLSKQGQAHITLRKHQT